jgi:hypothetical protein
LRHATTARPLHHATTARPLRGGCRLDLGQLLNAGAAVASAIDQGADLVIVNRFGRQEREGKGLSYLIERALSADIPVVIAVPSHRFQDWIRFAEGMSVKLHCDPHALNACGIASPPEMAASSGNTKASAKRSSNRHGGSTVGNSISVQPLFSEAVFSGALALSKTWRGRTISPQHQTCRLRDTV